MYSKANFYISFDISLMRVTCLNIEFQVPSPRRSWIPEVARSWMLRGYVTQPLHCYVYQRDRIIISCNVILINNYCYCSRLTEKGFDIPVSRVPGHVSIEVCPLLLSQWVRRLERAPLILYPITLRGCVLGSPYRYQMAQITRWNTEFCHLSYTCRSAR